MRGRLERLAVTTLLRVPPDLLRALVGPPLRSPEGYVLELESQALLWLARVTRVPELYEGDVAPSRRRFVRAATFLEPRSGGAARVVAHDRTVPGGAGPRRVRIYRPAAAPIGKSAPALVWFHGGGFVLGSIESYDGVCRSLASQAGIMVMSADYRLAPEHPFPAGLEDAIAVTRWVLDHGDAVGIDPRAVAVGGDSAGGNFAAATAQALRGAERRPVFQLLVYPATDATRREPSHRHFREGLVLTERNITWFLDRYLSSPDLANDSRVSPLLAADLSGLPPAVVMTAGFDPLRDEGRRYAERMAAAGVTVEHIGSEGSLHGFLNTAGVLRESTRMLALAADRLRSILGAGAHVLAAA